MTYLDTNIVIYAVERNPLFAARVAARLAALEAAGETFTASDLVRMECLVQPFRPGNAALEQAFVAFFASPAVRVVPVTPAVCVRAARVRASSRYKPMDALQLAAAVEPGATLCLTNDTRLAGFAGLPAETPP